MSAITWATPARARLLECALAVLAIAFSTMAWQVSRPVQRVVIGSSTTFDQIAVFAAGTPVAAIEAWRATVLGRVHKEPCQREMPCVRRLLRLSRIGPAHAELIAFDLDPATPVAERAAIVVAINDTRWAQASLHASTTPLHAAGG
ncbi:MAG: hypothetical protein ABI748_13210 [Dokdonella sp.]